jgi:hypothetical protein
MNITASGQLFYVDMELPLGRLTQILNLIIPDMVQKTLGVLGGSKKISSQIPNIAYF